MQTIGITQRICKKALYTRYYKLNFHSFYFICPSIFIWSQRHPNHSFLPREKSFIKGFDYRSSERCCKNCGQSYLGLKCLTDNRRACVTFPHVIIFLICQLIERDLIEYYSRLITSYGCEWMVTPCSLFPIHYTPFVYQHDKERQTNF